MDIRTLEAKTGLPRANIRFYEKEGFITPARKENGYRDYSEEDQKNLQRILLLRRLRFSLDEIRTLQSEDQNLEEVLSGKIRELEAEQRSLQAAAEVCRRLQLEKLRYSELEPSRFLMMLDRETERLSQPAKSSIHTEEYVQARDIVRMEPHPWKRLFARLLDEQFYNTVISAIFMLGFSSMMKGFFWDLLTWGLLLGCTVVLEPLFIACFATTPGKWFLGIRIYHEDGRRLTYKEAQGRTIEVLSHGMCWNLPAVSLWWMIRRFKEYNAGEPLSWDSQVEYVVLEPRKYRNIAGAVCWAASMAMLVIFVLHAQLPSNRGAISMFEFSQNYNEYAKDQGWDGQSMDAEGQFIERQGVHVINLGPTASYEYTEENGVLKEVTLIMECTEGNLVGVQTEQVHAAVAFLGAQKGVLWKGGVTDILKEYENAYNKAISYPHLEWLDDEKYHNVTSYSYEYGNVSIQFEYDVEGYYYGGDWWFPYEDAENPYFKAVMTMTVQ